MGEYFQDKESEEKPKKKKKELIEDPGEWFATYKFENERCGHTMGRDYDVILPIRHTLRGGEEANDKGTLNELRTHLKMSKIRVMPIGQEMIKLMDDIDTLIDWDESHMELLEEHIEHYQFLCESAINIINIMGEKLNKYEREEKEVEIKEEIELGPPLTEERKRELEQFYATIPGMNAWAAVTNPKILGNRYTINEMNYMRQLKAQYGIPGNQRIGLRTEAEKEFLAREKGEKIKEDKRENISPQIPTNKLPIQKTIGINGKEGENHNKVKENESEPEVYSPLSREQSENKPLKEMSDSRQKSPEQDKSG